MLTWNNVRFYKVLDQLINATLLEINYIIDSLRNYLLDNLIMAVSVSRSSHSEVFLGKGVLKIGSKFAGNTHAEV